MTKKLFMQFVLAVIALASTEATDHDALAKAQADAKAATDQLQALKDSDSQAAADNALTDDENAQVQKALNLISASAPPAPDAVTATAAAVAAVAPDAEPDPSAQA